MQTETNAREALVDAARLVAARGLSHGTTGNVSLRIGGQVFLTPTGCSLATVEPEDLAVIDERGQAQSAARPTKEAPLHRAVYRSRDDASAIVHTHSLHATALACLADLDEQDSLPPLTAYYAMKVPALPLVDYYPPGDEKLADEVGRVAKRSPAVLLRNHGPVIAAASAAAAVDIAEEIEQNARVFLLLCGRNIATLDPAERTRLYTSAIGNER